MTKADIVEQVYEKAGLPKKESAEVVECIFGALKEAIARGEKVKISGFGNFEVRSKSPRMGRNLWTGDAIEISARRVLTFKPSQLLKAALNVNKSEAMKHEGVEEGEIGNEHPSPIKTVKTSARPVGGPQDIS